MADVHTPEQRSFNMKRIRGKDTKIEITLRHALWARGYRYRKNYSHLPGCPDIAITKYRIAVFCDGEFFHGKDWERGQKEHIQKSNNSEYWIEKITRNIEHDAEIDKKLKALGWIVLRFWGKDILHNVDNCIKTIEEMIFEVRISDTNQNEHYNHS